MKDLCVFDLDKTLIPYDSFNELLRRRAAKKPRLLILAAARKAGLMGRTRFAASAHQALRRELADTDIVNSIAEGIEKRLTTHARTTIARWRDAGAYLVLFSSSPQEYVEAVGKRLSFDEAFGSTWREGRYLHLHGAAKLRLLDEKFPADRWKRTFAIADHPSDRPLLSAFDTVEYLG